MVTRILITSRLYTHTPSSRLKDTKYTDLTEDAAILSSILSVSWRWSAPHHYRDPPDSTLTFLSPLSLLCQDAHSALAADPAETIDNTGVGGQEDICCGEPETPGTEPEPAFFLVARIQEAVSFQEGGRTSNHQRLFMARS